MTVDELEKLQFLAAEKARQVREYVIVFHGHVC